MDNINQLRLEEYNSLSEKYRQLEEIVVKLLGDGLKNGGIRTLQIEHRIKGAESAIGKLSRKPDKYHNLHDLNDMLGIRIICYFTDQVDQSAALIEEILDVDTALSSDKRKLMDPTTFGYLSLHYICSLPKNGTCPEELSDLKFEIQIRTILQHTWAEIEHDLGYKTEFSIPRNVRREFSRVAGLLEIADESFLRIRNSIHQYETEVREKIAVDQADDMPLDLVSLKAYLELSQSMNRLLADIAAINNSKIIESDPEPYLQDLAFFNIHTLGELRTFVRENRDDALYFAKQALTGIALDELSSIVGLYYICRAKLVRGDYNLRQLIVFFMLGDSTQKRAEQHANHILRLREKEMENANK